MKPTLSPMISELERDALIQFNGNAVMKEAVRKIILSAIYSNGVITPEKNSEPLKNAALSLVANNITENNEKIGAGLRAMWEGVNALETGFNKIAEFKKEAPKPEKEPNKAL